jgi:uncharacterized protein YdiU (UPF0061 family)
MPRCAARFGSASGRYGVLRNWLAQRAIEKAEDGDMGELERLHEALAQPFADRTDDYASRPP